MKLIKRLEKRTTFDFNITVGALYIILVLTVLISTWL